MTRDETKELLMTIQAVYPNFNVAREQMSLTINAWNMMLKEYPAEAVNAALQIYIKTNNTGFAPSVSQIIGCIHKPKDLDKLTEGEAWYLVKKAIADSAYGAQEHFDELPREIQRAVGGAEVLRQWALTDSDEVNTVIMSNFQRTYKAVLAQEAYAERVPASISEIVKTLADKTRADRAIEMDLGVD